MNSDGVITLSSGMIVRRRARAVASSLAMTLALASCGGGGGGSAGSDGGGVIVAPPTPTPPPPAPPPLPPVGNSVFGALEQTSSQTFTVLGYGYRGVEVGGWGDLAIEAPTVVTELIGLRYVAPAQLIFTLSGLGDGALTPSGASGTDDRGRLTQLSYNALSGNLSLSLVRLASGEYLTRSALGYWIGPPSSGARATYRVAQFVYGVPTPPNEVPSVGIANYDAQIFGSYALASPGNDVVAYYTGTGRLSVNFGTKAVSGTISIAPEAGGTISVPAATYTLVSTQLASDGIGFQARLVPSAGGPEGVIEGRLTGTSAREMILRWQAPVQIGARSGLVFGVWSAPRI